MALTQSNWVTSSSNGVKIIKCTVTASGSEYDSYTLRTPKTLDPTRPWTVICNAEGNTLDGSTLPIDLFIGTSDDAALSGDNAPTATDAYEFKVIEAGVEGAVGAVTCDPNLAIADVTDKLVRVPVAPCYIFNLDGTSTLGTTDCVWIIVQKEGDNSPLDVKYDVSGVGVDPS